MACVQPIYLCNDCTVQLTDRLHLFTLPSRTAPIHIGVCHLKTLTFMHIILVALSMAAILSALPTRGILQSAQEMVLSQMAVVERNRLSIQ